VTPMGVPRSTSFDRRRFLVLAVSGVAVTMQTRTVASALASAPCDEERVPDAPTVDATALIGAWKRAQESGRPLLVMLDRVEGWPTRGEQWAAFLDAAADEALAEVALCELAFASIEQVQALFPEIRIRVDASTLGLVLGPTRTEPVRVEVSVAVPDGFVLANPAKKREIGSWLRAVEQALRKAIAPTHAAFDALLRTVRGASAVDTPDLRKELGRTCRAALARHAPAGARWSRYEGGCGAIRFDDGTRQESTGPCGMSMLPPESRRFLSLYTSRPLTGR
jgi:hypothetical protein